MPEKPSNSEVFAALVAATGWRAVDVAEALHVSKSLISAYLKGDSVPPDSKIELFKRVIEERKREKIQFQEPKPGFGGSGYDGMSREVLEEVFKTFAKALIESEPSNRKRYVEKIAEVVSAMDRAPKE